MNKKLCTALHLTYHLLFGSTMYVGGSHYVDELKALKKEINSQSKRVISVIDNTGKQIGKVSKACDSIKRIKW